MKKKFFIGALAVSLLLTLFSCSGRIKIESIEDVVAPNIFARKYKLEGVHYGTLYEIVTPKDTFLVFGVYDMGMQVLKRTPVK